MTQEQNAFSPSINTPSDELLIKGLLNHIKNLDSGITIKQLFHIYHLITTQNEGFLRINNFYLNISEPNTTIAMSERYEFLEDRIINDMKISIHQKKLIRKMTKLEDLSQSIKDVVNKYDYKMPFEIEKFEELKDDVYHCVICHGESITENHFMKHDYSAFKACILAKMNMLASEYNEQCGGRVTLDEYQQFLAPMTLPQNHDIRDLILGFNGEMGELCNLLYKKVSTEREDIDNEAIYEEACDALWYFTNILNAIGKITQKDTSFLEMANQNNKKLRKRYKNGYTKEEAQAKRDKVC